MKFTKKEIVQKVIAMLMVIVLTLADFALVGERAISYAIDMVKTNNDNVEFSAYFINSNNEMVTEADSLINAEDLKMYVEIAVKRDGYFKGEVELGDSSFIFKQESNSEYVKKIEDNKITLNKIDSETTAKIELGIKYKNANSITLASLNQENEINLKGTYVNSKKDKEIKGSTKIRVNWKKDDNLKSELDAKILTNNIYKVDGSNKKIVQVLVNSNLKNDLYPIKSSQITLQVPDGIEEYYIFAKNTGSTNRDIEFNENNYKYIEESNLLVINLQNEEKDGKINWTKNQKDSFVITYIYPEDISFDDEKINVESVIYPYDDSKVSNSKKIAINEMADGLVDVDISNDETSIYKGNIYIGAERSYTETTSINVNYSKAIQDIEVSEDKSIYKSNEEDYKANIQYKTTKVNKQKLIDILGEDFNLKILNQDKEEQANITKETEADENGDIIIEYSKDVTGIIIKANAPKIEGTIDLYNTKCIMNSNLKREEINEISKIEENFYVKYNKNQYKNNAKNSITLKETSMQTRLEVNKETLSTSATNEGVILTALLLTSGEDKELYKNPKIEIKLPKQIKAIDGSVQYRVLNGNGLKEDSINVDEENHLITILLKGEQKEYTNESIDGTMVQVRFNCTLNELATNKKVDFNLKVNNEFSKNEESNKVTIDIINPDSLIAVNSISKHSGKKNIKLDVNEGKKTDKVKIQVINNEQRTISGVNIIGILPTNNTKNNMGISIEDKIIIDSDNKNVKIYYTENENANENVENKENKWQSNLTTKSKKFLIVVDKLEQSEEIKASYDINIPGNLKYNLSSEESFIVKYFDSMTSKVKETEALTVTLATGVEAELKQNIRAFVGGNELKDNDEVKAGEIIKYEITLQNTGSVDAENVKVEGTVPEGTTRVELKEVKIEDGVRISDDGDTDVGDLSETIYEESLDKKVVFDNINIKSGKSVTLGYEVKVNSNISDNTKTNCQIITSYNNSEIKNDISHTLKTSGIILTMTTVQRVPSTIKTGYSYDYSLSIVNNSEEDKEDVKVKLNTNDLLDIKEISYDYEDKMIFYNNQNAKSEFTIEKIKARSEIKVLITTIVKEEKNNVTQAEISAEITDKNGIKYNSNKITENVDTIKLNLEVKSKVNSKENESYVVVGDKIAYYISVKNTGKIDASDLKIRDKITNYLKVNSVKLNGKEVKYNQEKIIEGENSYTVLEVNSPLKAGESASIVIETTVNDIMSNDMLKITNKVEAINNIIITESEANIYLIKNKNVNNVLPDEFGETSNDNTNDNDNKGNTSTENKYSITGTVWFDEDKDGQRNVEEQKLSSINVHLLDTNLNKIVSDTQTDEEGFYSFVNIAKGKYIVVFEYDTQNYIPTLYKAEGVQANKNSDAIQATTKINDENKTTANTESLNLTKNISNIDLGLIKAEKFDLELNKYVSKISVANRTESKTKEFNKSGLAKIEIAAKDLSTSNVVIEYIIEVKNTGEIPGYVQSIVDYKSNALEFSSSLNKDWYQSGKYLYNDSLSKTEINPGETKEITLVLTKKMTESNTGLINNTAEIAKAYNIRGVADTDSAPRNNETEDDLGSADVIISIKTGAAISYILLTLSVLVIIGAAAYLINRKILKKYI